MRYMRNAHTTYSTKSEPGGSGGRKMMVRSFTISACTRLGIMSANGALYGIYGFSGTAVSTATDRTARQKTRDKTHARSPERGGILHPRVRALIMHLVHAVVKRRSRVLRRKTRQAALDKPGVHDGQLGFAILESKKIGNGREGFVLRFNCAM